jgi:hypothetical protein
MPGSLRSSSQQEPQLASPVFALSFCCSKPDRRVPVKLEALVSPVHDGLRAVCHSTDCMTRESDSQEATNYCRFYLPSQFHVLSTSGVLTLPSCDIVRSVFEQESSQRCLFAAEPFLCKLSTSY